MSRRGHFLMIFFVGLFLSFGFAALPKTTFAASLGDTCTADAGCNSGDCSTAGACVCRVSTAPSAATTGASVCVAASTAAGTTDTTPAGPGEASTLETTDACSGTWLGFLCSGIVTILGLIADMIGRLILLVLTILIAFAKYNGFATAQVVNTGWPIVRDVVNMFFIIVLLVSAFSTIIDYGGGELHYSKVLPKLLLMAVLINFSKTLIQLAIDFSQVVMLTFVNAFASAAAGNFVNALGLTQMMSLATTAPNGTATQANVIMSYMLAIFLLSIVLSVVVIMTGFLIFRIVGLWICLILSPFAFFMTAVPGKIAKGAGAISGEYWSRLGSLLTGGPIMAFFLWLTLAVTQAANAGGGDVGLAPALHFDVEAGSAISFLSSIGNANSIASFVVGITLMLMGLDQAVKTASSISSTLGGFAQKARGAGMSLGRLGALAPFLAAGYAGRAGARAIDRRLDITRSASTLGLKTLKALPVPDSVASPVRAGLTRGLTMRREEAQKQAAEQKAVIDRTAKFGTDQEQKLVGATYSTSGSAFRTLGAKAGSMKVSEVLATDKIRDREARKNEDKYVKQLVDSGVSESEAKNGSKVLAEKDAYREQQGFLQNQLNLARGLGDLDKVEDLEKQIRVNPYLAADEKRASEIEKLATDPEKYKDVNKQDALSGDLLTGFMLKHGWQTDANGELKIADTAAYDRLKESVQKSGNKNLLEGLDAHEMFVMNSPGLKTTEANNLQHRKNSADGLMQTFDVSRSQDGKWIENKSGTRLHTKNYQDALGKVTSDRDIRSGASSGPAISQLDRDTNARVFMANGGAFSEFLSKSQTSSTDTVPVQTASRIVVSDISTGFDALKNDNTRSANDNLRGAGKILLQIDQQGVSDSQQIPVLASMANGMRDANGAVDASIIRKIDQLIPEIRDSVVKAAEVTKKRADDILRNGVKNAQEQAVVDLADAISKEIANNKKNVNSRILNAYRPGRNQNSNP